MTSSAVRTAARVGSETPGLPFRTRLTVASLTPACLATSASLPATAQDYGKRLQESNRGAERSPSGHALAADGAIESIDVRNVARAGPAVDSVASGRTVDGEDDVVAAVPLDRVVAGAAAKRVVAMAAAEQIVSCTAVEPGVPGGRATQLRQVVVAGSAVEDVVTAEAVELVVARPADQHVTCVRPTDQVGSRAALDVLRLVRKDCV